MFADAKNVLTFSNPNYTASGSGGEPGTTTDKKPFLWKKLKYDKSQVSFFACNISHLLEKVFDKILLGCDSFLNFLF